MARIRNDKIGVALFESIDVLSGTNHFVGDHMRVFASLLLGLIALPSGAQAFTVDEVVNRYVEARGGAAKLDALRSLRLTGKVVFGFGDAQIEAAWGVLQKRPAKIRTEVSLQGLTAVDAYDSREGWSLEPFEGRRDAQKASAVCPASMVPIGSTVPLIMRGSSTPASVRACLIPIAAALTFRVSWQVSSRSASTRPSMRARA